ncbi:dimethylhistidine N-methyltransferase [Chitinophaga sp. CF118]|uniref:L-histidine N(alpha)-methyltransferase n=1 Tax=Chitinophaga sp. CF118 TaxID=1884367 RepID=UPI0008DEEAC2|nr:L-histidine N(alpha)-methyltransferase [Chitinophaga sp. CF118]SFD07591.1 dimethylhistidine N-methyltransferase [Chitinophaga sp. CF118]
MNTGLDYSPAAVPVLKAVFMEKFREEILDGLNQTPKRLQSKYFYDKEGDALFQQIMACPEYYLTRCELNIFQHKTAQLAGFIRSYFNKEFDLIELGAGDATKSQYLLKYLADQETTFTYIPVDISGNILSLLKKRLIAVIPDLDIRCLEGEYLDALSNAIELSSKPKVVMFLGANIGNMEPHEATVFCRSLREHLKPGDLVIIGFDLKKHPKVILNAYNDQAGLTSQFNLNLLTRINRELNANFIIEQFEHYQTYDPCNGACKSYLVSLQDQIVTIGHKKITFTHDETIFMEISQKYTLKEIDFLAENSGFMPVHNCADPKGWFVDAFWKVV